MGNSILNTYLNGDIKGEEYEDIKSFLIKKGITCPEKLGISRIYRITSANRLEFASTLGKVCDGKDYLQKIKEAMEYEIGDIVKIVKNESFSQNLIGEIGKIDEINYSYVTPYRVHVPGNPNNGNWHYPGDLELNNKTYEIY